MQGRFLDYFKNEIIDLNIQNVYFPGKGRRKVLLAGLGFILCWQAFFYFSPDRAGAFAGQGRKDATGFAFYYAKNFLYYYYYLDLFPVTTTDTLLVQSKAGAEESIIRHGDSLLMEWGHWSRLGESARMFCFLPDAIKGGSAEDPSLRSFNALLFVAGLLLTFYAFWKNGMALLGFFTVLFFGSSDFLLYEIYGNQNIFGMLISLCLIILAAHLHLLKGNFSNKAYNWLLPVFSGVLLGTAVHIRSEALLLMGSCIFIYLFLSNAKWIIKGGLIALLLFSFMISKSGWQKHFDNKFKEAYEVVKKAGGHPYDGPRNPAHIFWHPVFCGLGDFDSKYGYKWHDTVAYGYAIPILKEKYGMDIQYSGKYRLDDYYDAEKKYYKKLDLIPEYDEVLKGKVVADIKNDPGWYITIIFKRICYVFLETSPISLNLFGVHIPVPFSGLLAIPFIGFFIYYKKWFYAKLLLFSFPLAATSVVIYAKDHTTYNSCYHFFLAALLVCWGIEFFLSKRNLKLSANA